MAQNTLQTLVGYCDRLLAVKEFTDWTGAGNGLEVENSGKVTRIGAAVDATASTIELAAARGVNFLLVHHGLFWGQPYPWTGRRYQAIRLLCSQDMAVYGAHLPLDAHARFGNNAQLCRALGLGRLKPFFMEKGSYIGWQSATSISRETLAKRLAALVGRPPVVAPGGPAMCRRIGVVSGGAGDHLQQAAEEGVDTFITGEGAHWNYAQAEDLGINVLYGGHYATEVFGVKALAAHLSSRFKLPWEFIDYPTGL